jgi:hypothetical protein
MRRFWVFRGLKFLVLVAVAVAVFGLVVMGLWNWLTPALFGWKEISYGQALALLVLSKILLGGFHRPWGFGMHGRHRMLHRWESMTPEEREKFRAGMHGHCGHRTAPEKPAV